MATIFSVLICVLEVLTVLFFGYIMYGNLSTSFHFRSSIPEDNTIKTSIFCLIYDLKQYNCFNGGPGSPERRLDPT